MPGGPVENGSCRWHYKKSKGMGSKSGFCAACTELEDMSATKLRLNIKVGNIVLEGSCVHKREGGGQGRSLTAAEADIPSSNRNNQPVERFIAGATGKMNTERSKKSKIKSAKRRKSVEDARRAEDVLLKESRKQQQGLKAKQGLLRRAVSMVAGREINLPKRKAEDDGKEPSRATKYRHIQAGVAVINGASRILNKNRKKSAQTTMKLFPSVEEGARGAEDCICYGNFHRKEDAETYHKPPRLQKELDRLFALRPKVSAEQAFQLMKDQIDPEDGGLMFCYSKRGMYMPASGKHKRAYDAWAGCEMCLQKPCDCNGLLLSVDQIVGAFGARAKSARKRGDTQAEDYSAARGRTDGP